MHAPDPVSGVASFVPSTRIDYQITDGGPVQRVKIETAAGNGLTHTSWIYSDGLGRRLLTFKQADPTAGDAGDWVVSGLPERSNGLVMAVHEPWFYTGAPADHPLSTPTTPSRRFSYDAFGRVVTARALDGTTTLRRVYRPLGNEDTDAAGRVSINKLNGHGRVIESIVRTADEERTTRYAYQVGGELAYVGQTHANDPFAVVRWLQYDSLGRNVLNAEPNTAKSFGSPASSTNMRAWRYAYDDAGQLVGTSDARGCGKNIFYDSLGRSIAEDFSPCLSSQEVYSEYDPLTGEHAEVLRAYDAPEPGQTTDFGPRAASLKGRLAATRDRAAHTRFGYDGRGRLVGVARQIARPAAVGGGGVAAAGALAAPLTVRGLADRGRAKERASLLFCATLAALLLFFRRARRPGAVAADRGRRGISVFATAAALALFTTACGGHGAAALGRSSAALTDAGYEATWARSAAVYDDANRVIKQTTGADVPELLGAGGESAVTFAYTSAGALRTIGGSYGDLVAGETHDADGLPRVRAYADAAATSAGFEYDERRRLRSYTVARPANGPWINAPGYSPPSTTPSTLQRVLVDNTFAYDIASNPSFIDDRRPASAWPEGFAPVARTLRYDSFDRIARVDNAYQGLPTWRDPLAVERASGRAPVPSLVAPNRVGFQTFEYDWRGNLTSTADDANLFYDRSLGAITLGTTNSGPDQLRAAGTGLTATHDDAGNLVDVVLQRPGTCTDAGGCVQRFHYDWDEVGQLSRARRWDYTTIDDVPALPTIPLAPPATTDLRYVYDEGGSRVLKRSVVSGGDAHYTAEILPSLRLELATWDDASASYARTAATEVVYLAGVGRVVHGPTLPSATGSPQHIFLMLPDHLGSTAAVIDRDTGELVERTTQQPYGAPDSDYRPDRWSAFREAYQFTGKEDDMEVGLTYFGARYYHAALGRFASADPLAIHALGGDGNPYAYVRGAVLSATDPFGLACDGSTGAEQCPDGTTNGGGTPPIDLDWLFGGGGGGGSGPGVLRGSRGGGGGASRPPSTSTVRVMSGGLNPSIPSTVRLAPSGIPDEYLDRDLAPGTWKDFGVGFWNAGIVDSLNFACQVGQGGFPLMASPFDTLRIDEGDGSYSTSIGHMAPMAIMTAFGGLAGTLERAGIEGAETLAAEAGGGGGAMFFHGTDVVSARGFLAGPNSIPAQRRQPNSTARLASSSPRRRRTPRTSRRGVEAARSFSTRSLQRPFIGSVACR